MSNQDTTTITMSQKFVSNIIAGTTTILLGFLLLLCAVKIIPISVREVLLPSMLIAVGCILVLTGLVQKNVVSIWCGVAFFVPSLVIVLVNLTTLGYSQLYPFYIMTPAIASIVTMLYSHEWREHSKVILFFIVLSMFFWANSILLIGWSIILPIMLVLIGLLIVFAAIVVGQNIDKAKNE